MFFGPFWSFFDQCMIQMNHLLAIALCVNSFARLQDFIINNTVLVPPDTKHGYFAEAIWPWCWRTGFAGGQLRFSPLRVFKTNPFFVTSHNLVQKWFSFLALKQYLTNDCHFPFIDHSNCVGPIYQFYWSSPFFVNICWLFFVTHLMILPIVVEFELGHHPVTPAIPCLYTFVVTRTHTVFHIEIATFKLLEPCLTCSNRWSVFTIWF
jgi:hypothetical protein